MGDQIRVSIKGMRGNKGYTAKIKGGIDAALREKRHSWLQESAETLLRHARSSYADRRHEYSGEEYDGRYGDMRPLEEMWYYKLLDEGSTTGSAEIGNTKTVWGVRAASRNLLTLLDRGSEKDEWLIEPSGNASGGGDHSFGGLFGNHGGAGGDAEFGGVSGRGPKLRYPDRQGGGDIFASATMHLGIEGDDLISLLVEEYGPTAAHLAQKGAVKAIVGVIRDDLSGSS